MNKKADLIASILSCSIVAISFALCIFHFYLKSWIPFTALLLILLLSIFSLYVLMKSPMKLYIRIAISIILILIFIECLFWVLYHSGYVVFSPFAKSLLLYSTISTAILLSVYFWIGLPIEFYRLIK